jgi:hypothetical protein
LTALLLEPPIDIVRRKKRISCKPGANPFAEGIQPVEELVEK